MSPRHCTATIAGLALLIGCGGREQSASPDASTSSDANMGDDSDAKADVAHSYPCIDTQTDPHNCGTCGHDCLGGSCAAGMCQPVVLVTVPSLISSFAIDANNIYWTSYSPQTLGGTVSKCAIAGCDNNPVALATNQSVPENIYVAGSSLYWSNENSGAIMTCSTDCSDDAATFLEWPIVGSGPGYVANAGSLFVTSGVVESIGSIFECPASGCPSPTTLVTGQQAPTQIITDGVSLYWVDLGVLTGGKAAYWVDGGVAKSDISGNNQITLASSDNTTGLAVDGTNVYWSSGDSVFACSIAGCGGSPTTLVSLPNEILFGVVVDQTGVYFGASSGKSLQPWQIMKCPVPSQGTCTIPTALTGDQNDEYPLEELALDSKRIYWASNDATQIFVLAK